MINFQEADNRSKNMISILNAFIGYLSFLLAFSGFSLQEGSNSLNDKFEILYSGMPPWGDSYYTAKIACGEIDGYNGEELVITDDYGTFQVLGWDSVNQTLYQKWLSDPVFESHKINKIFLIPQPNTHSAYIVSSDSANNLRTFKWINYLVEEGKYLRLKKSPTFQSSMNFIIGKFSTTHKGWEIASMTTKTLEFADYSIPFQILRTGYFLDDFHPTSSYLLSSKYKQPKLFIVNGFGSQVHGLVVASYINDKKTSMRITHISSNFKSCKDYDFYVEAREKIGWIGKITKDSPVYITTLVKNEGFSDRIRFYIVGNQILYAFQARMPSDISSWVLGDIDDDGLRELITLDFMGQLHIFRLRNVVKGF